MVVLFRKGQLRLIQGGRTLLPQLPNSSGTIARRPEDGEAEAGDAEVDSEVDLKALTVYTGGHNNNKTPPVDKCTHTTQRCSHVIPLNLTVIVSEVNELS